jgi:hypothetical protein
MTFLDHPQRLWWRLALFQVHLWVGIILCLYMLVAAVSGSLLVFRGDLEPLSPCAPSALTGAQGKNSAGL